jgi:CheY-like chemotaxis protein
MTRRAGGNDTSEAAPPLVLIVEDYQDCLDMYAAYLGLSGFRVIKASDGATALAAASSALPDVILMDLSLPGMDGCETTRRLKSNPATSRIPVVALTAQSVMDLNGLKAMGFDTLIAKPCLPDDLAELVRRFVASRTPAPTRS